MPQHGTELQSYLGGPKAKRGYRLPGAGDMCRLLDASC
jgi:hypothetical protein